MKKLSLLLGALMIAGASYACDGGKGDGKACCKKGEKKETAACCKKGDKKACTKAEAKKEDANKTEKKVEKKA